MIIEKTSSIDTIIQYVKLARQHHLYVSGWTLFQWYKYEYRNINTIALATVDEQPVGVGVLMNWPTSLNVGVFVKPAHRYKKIGSELYKAVTENCTYPIINDGNTFYDKINEN